MQYSNTRLPWVALSAEPHVTIQREIPISGLYCLLGHDNLHTSVSSKLCHTNSGSKSESSVAESCKQYSSNDEMAPSAITPSLMCKVSMTLNAELMCMYAHALTIGVRRTLQLTPNGSRCTGICMYTYTQLSMAIKM